MLFVGEERKVRERVKREREREGKSVSSRREIVTDFSKPEATTGYACMLPPSYSKLTLLPAL